MFFYLKIALRNLQKMRKRSLKTILTVVIGLSACMLAQGFISHTMWGLKESLIHGGLGHFQIYRTGYLEHGREEPFQYLISDSSEIQRKFKEIPGVTVVAPGLNFQGIINSGDKSTIFIGNAGLPRQEQTLNSFSTLKSGSFLKDNRPFGILIGSGIARKLALKVGDSVVLSSVLKDGSINALDFEVDGIIEVQIKAYNDVLLIANLHTIQEFVDLPQSVERLTLLIDRTGDSSFIEPAIRGVCDRNGLEYRDWRQLAGIQYSQPEMFYKSLYVLIMSIILIVVVFSIANTLNLATQERIREIGTIRSLGTTRLQVFRIFLSESFLIGLVGGLIGIAVGYGIAAVLNSIGGIRIPPPPGQARGYSALFKPGIFEALGLWMVMIVTSTVAGVYPAVKAARMQIVDSLRSI